jgi:hypothetical protein
MKDIDYWRLCEQLTVRQAAILMMGEDPGDYMSNNIVQKPYEAITHALITAVHNKNIERYIQRGEYGHEENDSFVDVESLIIWLQDKGVTSGFFPLVL